MVKCRGIDIAIVSPDLQDYIPEYYFDYEQQSEVNNVVDVHIPALPDAQFWLDYSIAGPHPPGVAYLFKLYDNDNELLTWDCTEKQNYRGKALYRLEYLHDDMDTGRPIVKRLALRFSPGEVELESGMIAIKLYRIKRRRRIGLRKSTVAECITRSLHLTGAGIVGRGQPKKQYEYDLLDAKDTPWATINFHCKSRGRSTLEIVFEC